MDFGKKGNIIATALIVVALLGVSAFLLQREIYAPRQSTLHKTMSAFEQNVYATPDDLLTRYAMQSYQNLTREDWFCGNYPSAPTLEKTKQDFSFFASSEIIGSLQTLTQEYPEYDISISTPQFELVGPTLIRDLDDDETQLRITNLTITIRDGDKLIVKNLSRDETYNMRFWFLYKGWQAWMKCDSGSIYGSLAKVFRTKSCAFFKDTCVCDPSEVQYGCCGSGPGGTPAVTTPNEDCTTYQEDKYQDFAPSERTRLKTAYGVTENDIKMAADYLAEDMTAFFQGATRTFCGESITMPNTGIVCSARVETVDVNNEFYSTYIRHNTGCLFQCQRTCGILTLSEFDSLRCAGSYQCAERGISCSGCTITVGTETISGCGGLLHHALANPTQKDADLATVAAATKVTCAPNTDVPPVIVCGYDAITEDPDYEYMANCAFDITRSSKGVYGPPAEQINGARDCNPIMAGASGISPAVDAVAHYNEEDTRQKCLEDDNPDGELWFGMGGWIDKYGRADIIITCADPGGNGLKPTQAEIKLSVDFRYACTDSKRMRAIAPPSCATDGTSGDPPTCNDLRCGLCEQCEEIGGVPQCVPQNNGNPCWPSANEICYRGTCQSGSCSTTGNDKVITNEGLNCGSDSECNSCSAGTCTPKTGSNIGCTPYSGNSCTSGVCDGTGSCDRVPKQGGTCGPSGCATCVCDGMTEQWTDDNTRCSPRTVPLCIGTTSMNTHCSDAQCVLDGTPPTRDECCASMCGPGETCTGSLGSIVCVPAGG